MFRRQVHFCSAKRLTVVSSWRFSTSLATTKISIPAASLSLNGLLDLVEWQSDRTCRWVGPFGNRLHQRTFKTSCVTLPMMNWRKKWGMAARGSWTGRWRPRVFICPIEIPHWWYSHTVWVDIADKHRSINASRKCPLKRGNRRFRWRESRFFRGSQGLLEHEKDHATYKMLTYMT